MKLTRVAILALLCWFATAPLTSCSKKVGCEASESLKPKTNKKGEFKRSKSSSGLYSKKMKKRMKN